MTANEPASAERDDDGRLLDHDEASNDVTDDVTDDVSDEATDDATDGEEIDSSVTATSVAEPLSPLEQALADRDEYLDALRRLQAEFDNYRKRVACQQAELGERASESVLERLLPTLDALDLALAHAGAPNEPDVDQLVTALGQIASLLRETLKKEGLERIDDVDVEFDPTVHDAVAHDEPDASDPADRHGFVSAVLRSGYRLKGRVVRPAMVRVRG